MKFLRAAFALALLPLIHSINTSCSCVTNITEVSAPNASTSAGCSLKQDWNNKTTAWCLVDQTVIECGTFQPGFGYVDTCIIEPLTQIETKENQSSELSVTTIAIIGAVVGTSILGVAIGVFKDHQQKVLTEKRQRRLAATTKNMMDRSIIYHVHDEVVANPTVVIQEASKPLRALDLYKPSRR